MLITNDYLLCLTGRRKQNSKCRNIKVKCCSTIGFDCSYQKLAQTTPYVKMYSVRSWKTVFVPMTDIAVIVNFIIVSAASS